MNNCALLLSSLRIDRAKFYERLLGHFLAVDTFLKSSVHAWNGFWQAIYQTSRLCSVRSMHVICSVLKCHY